MSKITGAAAHVADHNAEAPHAGWVFLVYSQVDGSSLVTQLGLPQYSYFFVLDKFLPLLHRLGEVIVLTHPDEADAHFAALQGQGRPCVFLSFTPPHYSYTPAHCPALTVFAWEFSNLPDETWAGESGRDWRQVFRQQAGAIPLSTQTEALVRHAMGADYPVKAIPVPVWDSFAAHRRQVRPARKCGQTLSLTAQVIDSRHYICSEQEFHLLRPEAQFNFPAFDQAQVQMTFSIDDEYAAYLGGFYESESWGTWSQMAAPWILLPWRISGDIRLEIECAAYGPNVGRTIAVECGGQTRPLSLTGSFQVHTLEFQIAATAPVIQFRGLSQTPVPGAVDPRTMGLGLRSLRLSCASKTTAVSAMSVKNLSLDGVVYTAVLNPADERKNWRDLVTAFCFAFRERPDATLILKMTHRSLTSFLGKLHLLLQQCSPYACRVIAVHGYLDEDQFDALIDASSYYVNASLGEGLCLPLMEFMSCGVPALATRNTAMLDYVDTDSHFVIASSPAPTIWPHDPRHLIRTLQHRVNWQSIVDAYEDSYQVAQAQPERYQAMAQRGMEKMRAWASLQQTEQDLRALLVQALTRLGADEGASA